MFKLIFTLFFFAFSIQSIFAFDMSVDPQKFGFPKGKYDKKPGYKKTAFNQAKESLKLSFKKKITLSPSPLILNTHYQNLSKRNEITILVMGDTGTGQSEQFILGEWMAKICKEQKCDLGLHMGDFIYANGLGNTKIKETNIDPKEIDSDDLNKIFHRFFHPYLGLSIPIWVVPGNHDWRGNIQANIAYTNHPINTSHFPRFVMPYNYFNILGLPSWLSIFGYDSTVIRHEGNFEIDQKLGNDQRSNYENISGLGTPQFNNFCKNNQHPWKILFGHHGIVSSSDHGHKNDAGLLQKIELYFKGQGKIDGVVPGLFNDISSLSKTCDIQLYLAGHDHVTEQQFLKLKGQAPLLHIIQGAGAKQGKIFNPTFKHPLIENREQTYLSNDLGFSLLKVSKDKMIINHYSLKNGLLSFLSYAYYKNGLRVEKLK